MRCCDGGKLAVGKKTGEGVVAGRVSGNFAGCTLIFFLAQAGRLAPGLGGAATVQWTVQAMWRKNDGPRQALSTLSSIHRLLRRVGLVAALVVGRQVASSGYVAPRQPGASPPAAPAPLANLTAYASSLNCRHTTSTASASHLQQTANYRSLTKPTEYTAAVPLSLNHHQHHNPHPA